MWKTASTALVVTLSLWLAGCSGSAGVDWGPSGTSYQRYHAPPTHRPTQPASPPEAQQGKRVSFWHDLNLR